MRLDGIRLPVREVVHRVDAPLVAGAVMLGVQDAVHHRVAHVQVGRGHVDLGAQRARAVGKLAGLHALEQVQVLFHASGCGRGSPCRARSACRGTGAPLRRSDRRRRPCRPGSAARPTRTTGRNNRTRRSSRSSQSKPSQLHVLHDGIDVLGLFLLGIGVVEAQVGLAAELRRQAEIQADRLGVADVQIAVRLRRKARVHAAAELVGLQVVEDDVADEIGRAAWADSAVVGIGRFICFSTSQWPGRCA